MQSVDTGDIFVGTEIDAELEGTLALGKTGNFVANIGTAAIFYGISVSICAAALGDGLSGSICDAELVNGLAGSIGSQVS